MFRIFSFRLIGCYVHPNKYGVVGGIGILVVIVLFGFLETTTLGSTLSYT